MNTEAARFWSKVEKGHGCWTWTGARHTSGGRYGWFFLKKVQGKRYSVSAHRWAYESAKGHIPDGLVIDHLCRNTLCVNPDHLEAVTPSVNTLRGMSPNAINARKVQCSNGHGFSPENTYVRPDTGGRQCRECKRKANAERGRKRRAEARAA